MSTLVEGVETDPATAFDATAEPSAPAVAPAVEDDDPWVAETRKYKWRSGHCGIAPCHDGKFENPDGENQRRCLHYAINGVRAGSPYVVCSCECHTGQDLPDMSDVVAEWRAAQKG